MQQPVIKKKKKGKERIIFPLFQMNWGRFKKEKLFLLRHLNKIQNYIGQLWYLLYSQHQTTYQPYKYSFNTRLIKQKE